jgi:hypothetical protein
MSKMTSCKSCGAEIATSAKFCPKCGAKNKKPIWKRVWVWILAVIILFAVIVGTGSSSDTDTLDPSTNSSEVVNTQPTDNEEAPPSKDITVTPEEEHIENLTMGQKNAIRKAESYLDFMAFSRTGLIKQLEFEDFSSEDATFAVDYIDVDWNKQAALKAESYLDMMAFSADGLTNQLEYEGFTEEQIAYALKAVGY